MLPFWKFDWYCQIEIRNEICSYWGMHSDVHNTWIGVHRCIHHLDLFGILQNLLWAITVTDTYSRVWICFETRWTVYSSWLCNGITLTDEGAGDRVCSAPKCGECFLIRCVFYLFDWVIYPSFSGVAECVCQILLRKNPALWVNHPLFQRKSPGPGWMNCPWKLRFSTTHFPP